MGWVENLKRFGLQGTVDLNSERVGPIGAGQVPPAVSTSVRTRTAAAVTVLAVCPVLRQQAMRKNVLFSSQRCVLECSRAQLSCCGCAEHVQKLGHTSITKQHRIWGSVSKVL